MLGHFKNGQQAPVGPWGVVSPCMLYGERGREGGTERELQEGSKKKTSWRENKLLAVGHVGLSGARAWIVCCVASCTRTQKG